jgi:hypothetical protein
MSKSALDAKLASLETRMDSIESSPGGITTVGTGLTESPAGTVNLSAANISKLAATSGTNTGDQTTISGNAGTATLAAAATVLATPRNIAGVAFDGSAAIAITTATVADSSNKRYVTDANLTTIGNQSGTNTGDQTAGAGLTGTTTLNVIAHADGSIVVNANDLQVGVINATQHGTLAGGTTHANVIAAGAAGFMTGADKTKLDAITGTHTGTNTGDITLAAVGASANANGATLTAQALNLQPCSASFPGVMTAAQFTALSTQSGTNTGDVTIGTFGTNPTAKGMSISGQVVTLEPASNNTPGALTGGTQGVNGAKTWGNLHTFNAGAYVAAGPWRKGVRAVSGTYTLVIADVILECDATSAAFTITFPALSGVSVGTQFTFIKIDVSANAVTLDGSGSELINGAATYALSAQYQSVTLYRGSATKWLIIV